MASLVDCLQESRRTIISLPDPPIEYHSLTIVADELSAFMAVYDPELIGGLTTFYDVVPYAQHRRGKEIRISIDRPQLNILSGSTPSNLIKFVPEIAWDQGFMSRVIMVYSEDRPIIDIFNCSNPDMPPEMIHDLKCISALFGEFKWTEEYARSIHQWRTSGQGPVPAHPKLVHYCSRRLGHVLKLSMVSAIDRSDILRLEQADFQRALDWLVEAECLMPEIFRAGVGGIDSRAMDEIWDSFGGVGERKGETQLVGFARKLVPAHSVMRVIEVMERSGMIRAVSNDSKTGMRIFQALERD